MSGEYDRCPRCGNRQEDTAILKCGNGHVYCESCESSSPIRSSYGHCPVCEDPGSILGTISSGSYSSDLSDILNDVDEYINKHYDEDVRSSYSASSDLFEKFLEYNWSKESSPTRRKNAKFLFAKAFIKGWNARGDD